MDLLVAGDDLENVVLGQKWHEELHELLFTALRELPEIERGIFLSGAISAGYRLNGRHRNWG
jgi:hypothetical protein